MQVRPDRTPDTAASNPLAVVAEARNHAAERLGVRVQDRTTGVVLESGQRACSAGARLALEQDVADHPALAGERVKGKRPTPGNSAPLRSR